MSELKILLLENPSPLYWILGAIELVALAVLYYRRTRGALIAAIVPVLLAVAVGVTAMLVTTERERLRASLDELVVAVESADASAVDRWVDSTYDDGIFTKAELATVAAAAADGLKVTGVRLTRVEIEMQTPEAQVELYAYVKVTETAIGRDVIPTQWRLWWRLRDGQWKLTSSKLLSPAVPRAPMGR